MGRCGWEDHQSHRDAERETALNMLDDIPGNKRVTIGTDKAYDTHDFLAQTRDDITPHVTQNSKVGAVRLTRTTRHDVYTRSLSCRARIEEIYGWLKTVGGQRNTRYRGEE
jgi:hypothetical protein